MKNAVIIVCVGMVFCWSGCSNKGKQQQDETVAFEAKDFEGVIFAESVEFYQASKDVKRWTPTVNEARAADGIARKCMMTRSPEIVEKIDRYRRQFVGLLVGGEKVVWVNYFLDESGSFKSWKTSIVRVKDGGPHFFELKISLRSATCYDLYIHGEA